MKLSKRFRLPPVYYGYWILVVSFFCLFISLGLGSYSFSLFVKPVEAGMGWGRGDIMIAVMIFHLAMAIASPFVGRLVDAYGVRGVVAIGAVIAGLGYLLLSYMQSISVFYIGHTIIGFGMAAIGQIPAATAVTNWFHRRRGLAIGIMFAGMGVGGLVLVPLIGGFLIPDYGWRTSYFIIAWMPWVLLIPAALFVLKTRPSDMGLTADSEALAETEREKIHRRVQHGHAYAVSAAVHTLPFWLIGSAYLIVGFSQSSFFFNMVPHLQEKGMEPMVVAAVYSFVGVGSAIGKIGFGWLCDYWQPRHAFSLGMSLEICSILLFTLTIGETTPLIFSAFCAFLFGLGLSGIITTLPLMVSSYFGLHSYGVLFGILSFGFNAGCGIGPVIAGYMYDMLGNYNTWFIACALMISVAMGAMLVMRSSGK